MSTLISQNKVALWVAEKFSGFTANRGNDAREVEESILCFCGVYAMVRNVVSCLPEQEERRGQKQKLCAEKQGAFCN